jgi:hypothetical protein
MKDTQFIIIGDAHISVKIYEEQVTPAMEHPVIDIEIDCSARILKHKSKIIS